MAEDEVKEKDMAKTDGITHYVCDRCGSDAYLAANSAASAMSGTLGGDGVMSVQVTEAVSSNEYWSVTYLMA